MKDSTVDFSRIQIFRKPSLPPDAACVRVAAQTNGEAPAFPLSRHAELPRHVAAGQSAGVARLAESRLQPGGNGQLRPVPVGEIIHAAARDSCPRLVAAAGPRSEEHTPELQS